MIETYSNEAFDRTQSLASMLTERDRMAGRSAPVAGYSAENAALAGGLVGRHPGQLKGWREIAALMPHESGFDFETLSDAKFARQHAEWLASLKR